MCESSAFILGKNNELEKVMENVVTVDPYEGKVYLTDLLGEQKIIDGFIKEIRLMDHKIILEELTDKNVGIISINKNEDINHVEDTILKANGNLLFNINFTDKFIDEVLLTELSEQVEMDIKNSEQLVSYVLDALKNEGAREKLQPLQDLGLIKIKSLEPDYMNTASVVLDGDGYVEKVEDLSNSQLQILLERFNNRKEQLQQQQQIL